MVYMAIRYVKRPMMRVNGIMGGRFYGVAFPNAEYGMTYPSVRYLVNIGAVRPKDRFYGLSIKLSARAFREFAHLYARDLDAFAPHMGRKFLIIAKALIENADSKEVSWR